MAEAEVEEVVHVIERQKKRLHFAGSLLQVQPAQNELRQLPVFHGLSDHELAKVPPHCCTAVHILCCIFASTCSHMAGRLADGTHSCKQTQSC